MSLGPSARWWWGKRSWEGRSQQTKRQSQQVRLLHAAPGPPEAWSFTSSGAASLHHPHRGCPLHQSSIHPEGCPSHLEPWGSPHSLPLLSCLDFGLSELIQSLDIKFSLGTSLVVQCLRLHAPKAGDPGSIPGQGTRSHMLQLRVCVLQQRQIPSTATKSWCSQINKYFKTNK